MRGIFWLVEEIFVAAIRRIVLHGVLLSWFSRVISNRHKKNSIGVTGLVEKSCEWFRCWNTRTETDRQTARLCSPFRKKKKIYPLHWVHLLIQPEPSEREEIEVGEATAQYWHLAANVWNSYARSKLLRSYYSPIYMALYPQNTYLYQYRCENLVSFSNLWRNEIRFSCGLTMISHFLRIFHLPLYR